MDDTLDQIGRARSELLSTTSQPLECKMSPDVFHALRVANVADRIPETVFGMKIVVDPSMGPGEWKLVSPSKPPRPQ